MGVGFRNVEMWKCGKSKEEMLDRVFFCLVFFVVIVLKKV